MPPTARVHGIQPSQSSTSLTADFLSRGFSLVEMAVVLLLAAILLSSGLKLLATRADSALPEVTRRHQESIKTALISYLGQMKRLPCPDTNFDGSENRDNPATPPPCNSYVGTVPYIDLGLDRATVLDGFENYITYVVTPNPAAPSLPANTPAWTTAWLYSYASSITDATRQATGLVAFWPSVSTGGITALDVNNIATSNPAAPSPTGAVVVLISHGKNGFGARNIQGGQNNSTAAGQDEQKNAPPIPTYPISYTVPVQISVYNRDVTDQNVLNHGAFDDIVLVLRREDLVSTFTTSSSFQSASSWPALNQANDAVIGQIMNTRALCSGAVGSGAIAACTSNTYYYVVPATVSMTALPVTSQTWGVSYSAYPSAPTNAPIYYGGSVFYDKNGATVTSTAIAYTLTSGDNNSRTVTCNEIGGIINKGAGFN